MWWIDLGVPFLSYTSIEVAKKRIYIYIYVCFNKICIQINYLSECICEYIHDCEHHME